MERQIADLQAKMTTALERVSKLEALRDVDSKRMDAMDGKLDTIGRDVRDILLRLSKGDGETSGRRRAWGWLPWLGGAGAATGFSWIASHLRFHQYAAGVVAILLLTAPTLAAPPPGVTPSPWWEGARQPETGISCCGSADGQRVHARWLVDHWQALVDGAWRDVPPDVVLRDYPPEPSGSAAVWIVGGRVFCFSRPAAGG